MDDDIFIFEIHFGGRFKNINGLVYVDVDISVMMNFLIVIVCPFLS